MLSYAKCQRQALDNCYSTLFAPTIAYRRGGHDGPIQASNVLAGNFRPLRLPAGGSG
jgi:hypothetical protein